MKRVVPPAISSGSRPLAGGRPTPPSNVIPRSAVSRGVEGPSRANEPLPRMPSSRKAAIEATVGRFPSPGRAGLERMHGKGRVAPERANALVDTRLQVMWQTFRQATQNPVVDLQELGVLMRLHDDLVPLLSRAQAQREVALLASAQLLDTEVQRHVMPYFHTAEQRMQDLHCDARALAAFPAENTYQIRRHSIIADALAMRSLLTSVDAGCDVSPLSALATNFPAHVWVQPQVAEVTDAALAAHTAALRERHDTLLAEDRFGKTDIEQWIRMRDDALALFERAALARNEQIARAIDPMYLQASARLPLLRVQYIQSALS